MTSIADAPARAAARPATSATPARPRRGRWCKFLSYYRPHIGLLIADRHLILDFSSRPFDAIAFERMASVAQSALLHVPGAQ